MLPFVYVCLMAFGSTWGRDSLRARTMPTISNSLVNLGKMDITFYIGKENGVPAKENIMSLNPKPMPMIDECLCNSMRNAHDTLPLSGSSSFINKILSSNDLFNNFHKETYGPQCCESHEEKTITFEFEHKPLLNSISPKSFIQPFPKSVFDSFLPPKNTLGPAFKPKAIEIFLFPKNKEGLLDSKNSKFWMNNFTPKKSIKKDIKLVGDKDIKSTFDTKNTNDVKNFDDKFSYDTRKDGDMLKGVKSSFDFKNFDSLKYDTVPSATNKEIGLKDTEADVKDETQKDVTNVSTPQPL